MTPEEKLQIDLLWYQAMEDCVKEESIRYSFAALVRADERERCAKIAEETVCDTHLPTGVKIYGTRAAKAIRARGKK